MTHRGIDTSLVALAGALASVGAKPLVTQAGRIVEVGPAHLRIRGLAHCARLGDWVTFGAPDSERFGEVIHIQGDRATVKPFDANLEIGLDSVATYVGPKSLHPDVSWKGRIVDALARPIDGQGPLDLGPVGRAFDSDPPEPLRRHRLKAPLRTGVRAIDILTPLCAGQRIGIFAGSGVGKSTLLAMLVQAAQVDSIVIALVGERGREVREFVEDTLGARRARTVAVVSTSDESPMMRRRAPLSAMAIAEHLRDCGEQVLLVVDSVTRYAHALRDVALAAGEPPVARGYTPSVYAALARYLERAGPGVDGGGSITGLFSILVDGDDHNDPIADSIRGILDGHIVLDRRIAEQGRYPAIDLLTSVSRLADAVWTPEQRALVMRLRAMISRYEETRDLRLIGGYRAGTDSELDRIVALVPRLYEHFKQAGSEQVRDPFSELMKVLSA